jgi:uncharacterized protein (TIRG00374 family)
MAHNKVADVPLDKMKLPPTLIRRLFYWGLPVAILFVVFRQVDLQVFRENLLRTDPIWVLVALVASPFVVSLGALRWNYLLRNCIDGRIPLAYSNRQYWMGLPLGMFVPAGLGWDAYRVLAIARRYGHYTMNMGVILVEKAMALVICMLLIVLIYPLIAPVGESPQLSRISVTACILLAATLVFLASAFMLRHFRIIRIHLKRLESRLSDIILAGVRRIRPGYRISTGALPVRHLVQPLASPLHFAPLMFYSLAIQVVAAAGAQLYFIAVGYDIPFLVNLFVTPVLFFIFLLPVSFGSLGVREAAYIILYGMFGVPMETALLVSFLAMAGLLLNNLIASMVIMIYRDQYMPPRKEAGL